MRTIPCDLGVGARVFAGAKILVVQEARGPFQGKWGLPKGFVNEGESPEQAVLRELGEETNLEGEVVGLSGVRTTLKSGAPSVFLCYDVAVENTQTTTDDDEISRIQWVNMEESSTLDWISKTMRSLAVEGWTSRAHMTNQFTDREPDTPYAFYTSLTPSEHRTGTLNSREQEGVESEAKSDHDPEGKPDQRG